jgi:hypothetical protein
MVLLIPHGKDVIMDPTLLNPLAAHHHATTSDQESVVDPDKRLVIPREDVTLLVLADPPFPKESTSSAVREEFVTAKAPASSDPQESKLLLLPVSLISCFSSFLSNKYSWK